MRRSSLFWLEFLLLLLAVAATAGALWYTGPLDRPLASVGPVVVTPYLLTAAVLGFGALLMAIHGWVRTDGSMRRGHTAGAAAASDLVRLIANNPPGTVQEGEKLDAHMTAVADA